MVSDRLAKNAPLHRALAQGIERALVQETPGQTLPTLTVPFNGKILERLFHFIVRGLVFFHWGVSLGDQHGVRVITLTEAGREAFSLFLNMNASQRVGVDLGGGTFHYEGTQCDYPELTVWRFSIYGGLIMAGDPDAPGEIATAVGAMTATQAFLERPAVVNIFGSAS